MKGDDRVRHCKTCRKNVYNFGELTRDEIDRIVMTNEGKLCARFFVRADGSMLTKDCNGDIRVRPLRRAAEIGIAAAAAAALASAGGAFIDGHRAPTTPNVIEASMGTISLDENRLELPPGDSCIDETSCGGQPIAMPIDDALARAQAIEEARRASILGGVTVHPWYPPTSPEVQDGANFAKREAKRQNAASSGPSFNIPDKIDPK